MYQQTTPFSCGPAAVISADLFMGGTLGLSESELIEVLDSRPRVGTDTYRLAEFCKRNFPGVVAGEGSYRGGLAIANIRNWRDGQGHFVVFLSGDDDEVTIFDPFDGSTSVRKWVDLDFCSGCGGIEKFAINLSGSLLR